MIFRNTPDRPEDEPGLEQRLQSLEQQAEIALPGFDAQFFNRAGVLCLEAGDVDRALGYHGRAINAYLRAGRYNAASAVCRKALRISPSAVRVRCTLAWLSIGKGLLGDAQREVADYVEAAVSAGQSHLARKQVRKMAEATANAEFRAVMAEHLHQLGAPDEAEDLLAREPEHHDDEQEPEALWSRVLRAVLASPEDLLDDG